MSQTINIWNQSMLDEHSISGRTEGMCLSEGGIEDRGVNKLCVSVNPTVEWDWFTSSEAADGDGHLESSGANYWTQAPLNPLYIKKGHVNVCVSNVRLTVITCSYLLGYVFVRSFADYGLHLHSALQDYRPVSVSCSCVDRIYKWKDRRGTHTAVGNECCKCYMRFMMQDTISEEFLTPSCSCTYQYLSWCIILNTNSHSLLVDQYRDAHHYSRHNMQLRAKCWRSACS